MKETKPTWLYIKQHSITGLLYFGCTTRRNINTYAGSGKYWSRHIRKHGRKFVKTLLCIGPYTDQTQLFNLATWMSSELDIVNSDRWANLTVEDGMGGGPRKGFKHSEESKQKMSIAATGRIVTEEQRQRASIRFKEMGHKPSSEAIEKARIAKLGISLSQETKDKISQKLTGRKDSDETKQKKRGRTPHNKGVKLDDTQYQKMIDIGFIGARKGKPGTMTGKKHTPEQLEKMRLARQGKRWFTNGKINRFISEQPDGFYPGRTLIKN